MDFRQPLGLFCLFMFVVHSLHHLTPVPWINVERQLFIEWVMPEHMFIEWALSAAGTLIMASWYLTLAMVAYVAVAVENVSGVNWLTVSCPAAVRLRGQEIH